MGVNLYWSVLVRTGLYWPVPCPHRPHGDAWTGPAWSPERSSLGALGSHWDLTRISLGSHWDFTGISLGSHWELTGISLGSHWDPTGIPLGSLGALGSHWEHTGSTGSSLGSHWDLTGISLGPHWEHWDLTGISLGPHWDPTGSSLGALGALGAHWDLTGIPLGPHWDPTGISLGSHWDLTGSAGISLGALGSDWDLTGIPLGAHWEHWDLTGISLGSHWDLTGISLGSHWDLTGISLGSHWDLTGSTGSTGTSLGSHWDLTGSTGTSLDPPGPAGPRRAAAGMAKLLVPLVVLGAVSGAGVPAPPRCPPRCLCPAAAPSPTLLCARTGLLAVPPSLDRGAVELRLADNFIGAVGRADFANMSSLVHLTLSRNGLRRLAPGAFADLRALRALHLDGNRLPALSGPQLRGLASLRHLILANNQLAAIDAAAFAAFAATVEDLDLSHNNLPALPWDAVAAMGSLATLTLDHNLLERVPAGAVARLPRLARLDLTANRLRALPPVPGPPGPALAAGGNPLHCNCELLWLRRAAQPGRLETCATPAPLAGRLLGAVPEEELTCRAPAVTAAAAHPPAVTEGQPLRLGCAAVGDPPPALHWLGPDGRVVQNGSRRSVGADGSLELRVATLRDHGGFTCVAANAAGEAAARVDVVVVPLPVPRGRDGDGEAAAAEAGPGPSDMARAGGNDTWGGPGERRAVAAEVTGSSARIRWLPQRHVPGVRMVQIQYNSSADDALVYRWEPGAGLGAAPVGFGETPGAPGWSGEGAQLGLEGPCGAPGGPGKAQVGLGQSWGGWRGFKWILGGLGGSGGGLCDVQVGIGGSWGGSEGMWGMSREFCIWGGFRGALRGVLGVFGGILACLRGVLGGCPPSCGGVSPLPDPPRPLPRLLPPSSRTFVLRDLAPGRQYELCVSALRVLGDPPAAPRPLGCVSFATAAAPPGCAAPPRPHFLGGTVIIVIGAAIAASVLVFILILTARWKAAAGARRPPPALTSVCSQTNGGPRPAETPELPALPPLPPAAAGGARGLFPSHSYPRRARPRRHGSLPRLDAPEGSPLGPPLRPSFGSTHWMLES
ncbi:hypothetical protein DV515_00018971, partial [Chloebia gouldiae]